MHAVAAAHDVGVPSGRSLVAGVHGPPTVPEIDTGHACRWANWNMLAGGRTQT